MQFYFLPLDECLYDLTASHVQKVAFTNEKGGVFCRSSDPVWSSIPSILAGFKVIHVSASSLLRP